MKVLTLQGTRRAARLLTYSVTALCAVGCAETAHAQSVTCSDVIARTAEAGLAADTSGPPFPRETFLHDRVISSDSLATNARLCLLALTASMPNHRAGYQSIESALQRITVDRGRTPEMQFAFAALRNQSGEAGKVLSDATGTNGVDPLVRFEIARALFLTDRADDGLDVLKAAVTEDLGAAALFYHVTYPVINSETRTEIARTPAAKRGARLIEEWEKIAWSSALTTAERLAVHFRRLAHANAHFYGVARPQSDSTDVLTSGRVQPDPRWDVYMRFGEPARVVRTMNPSRGSGLSTEYATWVYADPMQRHPTLFHFSGANSKYNLITNAGCNLNWLGDRASLAPRIGQLYQACTTKSDFRKVITQLTRETNAAYRNNREREFVVPSKLAARFAYRFYTFADPATLAPQVIAIAYVPAEEIPTSNALRAGVFLRSQQGEAHSQLVDYTVPDTADAMIAIAIHDVTAGDYTYRVRVSDEKFREGFVYGGEYTVALGGTEQVRMSDLIIAKGGAAGPLRRFGESLQPVLGAVTDASFDLYGEAYGLAPNEEVEVNITIARKRFLRRTTEVAVKFTNRSGPNGEFAFRHLITHDLDAGEYQVSVALHSMNTGMVEQAAALQIQ